MDDNSVYNILVVDDSAVDSKVVAHALQRAGYSVTAITQAGDALETLETGDFAVVLLDVNMPSIDGFELLQEIKRRPHFRDLVIIMMSSDAGERRIVRYVQNGHHPTPHFAVHRGCCFPVLRLKHGARTRGSLPRCLVSSCIGCWVRA
jgi:CheY-like chemotaxis protein